LVRNRKLIEFVDASDGFGGLAVERLHFAGNRLQTVDFPLDQG